MSYIYIQFLGEANSVVGTCIYRDAKHKGIYLAL